MRLWAIIWQTLWSFSAVPEERSRTSFHGAGHIPWTMSSVPLSDGCKSPMKMHGTSSCGCASSVITSIESKRRLLSQAVAVVTTCDNSKVAVHFCFGLWPLFYRWARNNGWITQVMCGGCIIETQFFDRWALCVMTQFSSLRRWTVLSLEATQTGSDDLKEIFESHLVEAGHMLVLLDTIVSGAYLLIYLIWWKCVSTCEYVTERLWNTYLGGSIMWW